MPVMDCLQKAFIYICHAKKYKIYIYVGTGAYVWLGIDCTGLIAI